MADEPNGHIPEKSAGHSEIQKALTANVHIPEKSAGHEEEQKVLAVNELDHDKSAGHAEEQKASAVNEHNHEKSAGHEEEQKASAVNEHNHEKSAGHEEEQKASAVNEHNHEKSAGHEEEQKASAVNEHNYEKSAGHEEEQKALAVNEHNPEKSAVNEEKALAANELQCSRCFRQFKKKTARLSHERHCGNKRQHFCDICKKSFNTAFTLKMHNKRMHLIKVEIDQDDNIIEKSAGHEEEQNSAANELQCSRCFRQFEKKTARLSHERYCKIKRHFCKICKESFHTALALKMHNERMHVIKDELDQDEDIIDNKCKENETETEWYKCVKCERKFYKKGHYNYHARFCRGFNKVCKHCNVKYSSYNGLRRHLKNAKHGKWKGNADNSKKPEKNSEELEGEQEIEAFTNVINETGYKCAKCERTFQKIGHYQQHSRFCKGIHRICKVCSVEYSNYNNLVRHLRTSKCGKQNGIIDNSNKTENDCEKQKVEQKMDACTNAIGETEYKCAKCERTFHKSGHYKTHARFCRGFNKVCKFCNTRYSSYTNLRRHLRTSNCGKLERSTDYPMEIEESSQEKESGHNIEVSLCTKMKSYNRKWLDSIDGLSCRLCNHEFSCTYNLLRHMRRQHKDVQTDESDEEMKLRCSICHKVCLNKSGLKTHETVCLKMKENRKCVDCGIVFGSLYNMRRHVERAHGKDVKGKLLNESDDQTDNHASAPMEDCMCLICLKTFSNRVSLMKHKNNHNTCRPQPRQAKERHMCHICASCFESRGGFDKHMRSKHFGIRYTCKICNKQFNHSTTLKVHMRKHDDSRPYICDKCGKSFVQATHLNRHYTIHTGERKYKCKICSKTFRDSTGMRSHEKIHAGVKLFKCEICTYSTSFPSSLKTHIKIHTMKRDWQCELCERSFTQKVSLRRHMAVHAQRHNKVKPAYYTKPTFFCDQCPKGFVTKRGLVRHKQKHSMGVLKWDTIKRIVPTNIDDEQLGTSASIEESQQVFEQGQTTTQNDSNSCTSDCSIQQTYRSPVHGHSIEANSEKEDHINSENIVTNHYHGTPELPNMPVHVETYVETGQFDQSSMKMYLQGFRNYPYDLPGSTNSVNNEHNSFSLSQDLQKPVWKSFRFSQYEYPTSDNDKAGLHFQNSNMVGPTNPSDVYPSTGSGLNPSGIHPLPGSHLNLSGVHPATGSDSEMPGDLSDSSDTGTVICACDVNSDTDVTDLNQRAEAEYNRYGLKANAQQRPSELGNVQILSDDNTTIVSQQFTPDTSDKLIIDHDTTEKHSTKQSNTENKGSSVSFYLKGSLMPHDLPDVKVDETAVSNGHDLNTEDPVKSDDTYVENESESCEVQCMKCTQHFYSILDLYSHSKQRCERR